MPLRQSEPETRMVLVPAGPDNNDIYHIPLCGLSFNTTWQQLKDFVRAEVDVLRAEVFQNSTTGWVRVHGAENFEKAFARLNGGYLNDCFIIASDQNRDKPIRIKLISDCTDRRNSPPLAMSENKLLEPNYGGQLGPYYTGLGPMPMAPSTVGPTMELINPPLGYYDQQAAAPMPQGTNYGYNTSKHTVYDAAPYTGQYLATNTAHYSYYPGTVEGAQIGAGQYAGSTITYMPNPTTTADSFTHTAARRVLVKGLPRREATETYIRELLRTHVSTDAAADVVDVDISLDHSGKPKGYAMIQFRTFDTTMRTVAAFDGLAVLGGTLGARMGIDDEAAGVGKHSRRGKKHSGRKDKKDYKDSGYGPVGQHSADSSAFVAVETSQGLDEAAAEKEKHRRKKEAPVIVDGSSSRQKKTSDTRHRF